MAYDNPERKVYDLGVRDFAGGAVVDIPAITGPSGKKGRLVGLAVQVTEAVVGTTTAPTLTAGKTAGAAEYGTLTLPTATAVGALINEDNDSVTSIADFVSGKDATDTEIAAGTSVYLRCTLAVGGTITGQGNVQATIDWYN